MREFGEPYHFILSLAGEQDNRGISKKEQEGKIVRFETPLTQNQRPKIYIVLHEGKVVYVGYTAQSIGSRLSLGLSRKGQNGYHGYKWKQLGKVQLLVWVFDAFGGDNAANEKHKLFVEAIEAELVYLVRTSTGKWPEYQNEIHFNNEKREEVLEVAEMIYNRIKEN